MGEGSDHLQLIKFWPSCDPREGGLRRGENFRLPLLQPARSVCVSERFINSSCRQAAVNAPDVVVVEDIDRC